MKQITEEWIEKAEGDWATMSRETEAQNNPNYDAVCFHAQQCAEKYLKARLQEAGINFGKIHLLLVLHASVLQIEPTWTNLDTNLTSLDAYAVNYRYPGDSANETESKDAVENCRLIRATVRQALGLPVN